MHCIRTIFIISEVGLSGPLNDRNMALEQRFSKCVPGTLRFRKELLGVPPIPDVKLFTFSSL